MGSFDKTYAEIYDILYADKDYHNEIKLIEEVINKNKPDFKRILDYGCGTGNHLKIIASKGIEVYGLDKNKHMLNIARQKTKNFKNVKLYSIDERTAIIPNSIDVCVSVFDVLSYMNTNVEINDFIDYIKTVLVNDGLFIFDFWYGPGVIALSPEKRWKEYKHNGKVILRLTYPVHDSKNCIVNVSHDVIVLEKNRVVNRFIDKHNIRYFFKNEILLFLDYHGIEVLKFGTWKDLNTPPTTADWSTLVVSRLAK